MLREMSIRLTAPDGSVLDVSDRVVLDSIGPLSTSVEEDLLEFVHDDLTLDCADGDGAVADFLDSAQVGDEYSVVLERQGLDASSLPWIRLYGGLLDVASIRTDPKTKVLTVDTYGLTEKLEKASAEDIKREITGRTGSVTNGSDQVTLSSTTDLDAEDEIRLTKIDGESETQVILSVDSSTLVTTVETWGDTYSNAELTLETPYYRNRTVEDLVSLVFDEAGLAQQDIRLDGESFTLPTPTALNTSGLPGSDPRSMTTEDDRLNFRFAEGEYSSPDPQDPFVKDGTASVSQGDWTPYMSTEPTTIRTGSADDGTLAWDHTNGHDFGIRAEFTGSASRLHLQKDGSDVELLDSYLDGSGDGHFQSYLDYDPDNDEVWVSFKRVGGSGNEGLARYDVAGDSLTTVSTAAGAYGRLRTLQGAGYVAHLARASTTMKLYTLGTSTVAETVTVPFTALFGNLWTLRVFGDFAAALYFAPGDGHRVTIWDATTWAQLADWKLTEPTSPGDEKATVFTQEDGSEEYIAWAGGRFFVFSKKFGGVIPYADFDGKSCAEAIKQLAIPSIAIFDVDEYGHAAFLARGLVRSSFAVELETPLDQENRAVHEKFAGLVVVTGKTPAGEDIEEMAGDPSAGEPFELRGDFITNPALAASIAAAYEQWLSRRARQASVTVQMGDTPLRPLQAVLLDGVTYDVHQAEADLEVGTQDLLLVEAVTA